MAQASGADALFAIVKGSAWGTAVDCDVAGAGFRAKSWTADLDVEELPDEGLNNDAFRRDTTDTGRVINRGSFTVDLKYEGQEWLASIFGSPAVAVAGSYYRHNWTWANDLTGIFWTICWFDGYPGRAAAGVDGVHQIDSAKITGVTWRATAGRRVEAEVRWVGRAHEVRVTSTNADLDTSLTEPSSIAYVKMLSSTENTEIAAVGSAPAEWEIESYEVSIDRNFDVGDRAYTSTTAPYMREPRAAGATCALTVTKPHDDITYINAVKNGTLYNLHIDNVVTASEQSAGIFLPSVKWTKATHNIDGRSLVPQVLTGVSEYAATTAAHSDFNAPIDPLRPSYQYYNSDSSAAWS